MEPIKASDRLVAIALVLRQQARAIQLRENWQWMATILKAIPQLSIIEIV